MLKSLPNGKEKLEMADALRRALAVAGQLGRRNVRVAIQHLSRRPREPHIGRGIDAVSQVHAYRTHGCAIAESESHIMDHIVEILRIVLMEAKGNVTQAGIDVPHVVEQHALYILSAEGKAHLYIIDEESVAPQGKSGGFRRR